MSSKTSLQYQLPEKEGKFVTTPVAYPTPGPDEVCVRTRAVGLNPLDWKIRASGLMVQSWPTVLGLEAAGVIDSVGANVQHLKPGDEVVCIAGRGNRARAHQEIMTIPSFLAVKKPTSISFEEASSLPIGYQTAIWGIIHGLRIPLGQFQPTAASAPVESILVVGGSSSVGSTAIQLLRQALPSATILTTSSAAHHSHLTASGATKCFERSAQEDASVIKAATPGGAGVDAIFDSVSAAGLNPAIFDTFKPTGPKIYSQVAAGPDVKVPEGVHGTLILANELLTSTQGALVLPGLVDWIQSSSFRFPVKVDVVGKGLNAIEGGIDKLFRGVSGTKLVVSI